MEVPRRVIAEVAAGQDGQAIIDTVEADDRVWLVDDIPVPAVVVAWDLGLGETQVLGHCLGQASAVAVLDDASARQCGRSLGQLPDNNVPGLCDRRLYHNMVFG